MAQSLFGLTPDQIQEARRLQQQQAINQQAQQFGMFGPLYAAGRGMAQQGIGQLASLFPDTQQDPMLQRATATQSIIQKYQGQDFNDPAVLSKMAGDFSAAGQPEIAMQLGDRVRSMLPKPKEMSVSDKYKQRIFELQQISPMDRTADENKELFAAMSALGREDKTQSAEEVAKNILLNFGGIPDKELTETQRRQLKSAENVLNRGRKTIKVEADGRVQLRDEQTGALIADLGAVIDRRAVTNVTVQNTAENEYGKLVGKKTAENDISLIDNAQAAARNLPKMYETRRLIETGDINTGLAAEVKLVIDKARSQFLRDKRAGKRVTDTEYLDALLGSDVFPQISALGIGARGLDTPAERDYLRQVITGTITLDKNTLKRMTDLRIKGVEDTIRDYNKSLSSGSLDQWQTISGRKLNPIDIQGWQQQSPAPTPASTPTPSGVRRFNPATGRLE